MKRDTVHLHFTLKLKADDNCIVRCKEIAVPKRITNDKKVTKSVFEYCLNIEHVQSLSLNIFYMFSLQLISSPCQLLWIYIYQKYFYVFLPRHVMDKSTIYGKIKKTTDTIFLLERFFY